jgi:Domain of unknown function (DUF4382)
MKFSYLALIAAVLVSVVIAGCLSVPAGQATLIIAVKDAPKTTDIGIVSSLNLTISEVSVHQAMTNQTVDDSDEETIASESTDASTAGWIVVVDQIQTVDLIALQNVSQVLGQKTLDAGNYTQIRLKIDSGTVTVDGIEHDLVVPSGVLKLNRGFTLRTGDTLQLTLDFDVEKSLIVTGSDQFKLEPVIAVLSG